MATILDLPGYIQGVARRARILREWLALLETYPVIRAGVYPAYPPVRGAP